MKRPCIAGLLVLLGIISAFGQEKPDALKSYRQGRNLEAVGRMEDAKVAYAEAIEIRKQDLADNDKTWKPTPFTAGRCCAWEKTVKR